MNLFAGFKRISWFLLLLTILLQTACHRSPIRFGANSANLGDGNPPEEFPLGSRNRLKDLLEKAAGEQRSLLELLLRLAEAEGSPNSDQRPIYVLAYVESGSGRTVIAAHDILARTTELRPVPGLDPVPNAITIKGITSSRQVFHQGDLPLAVTDTLKARGSILRLHSDGTLRDSAGNSLFSDPTLKSVSYAFGIFHWLRSDGSVWVSLEVSAASPKIRIPGLTIPQAKRIAWGTGS